MKNPPTNRVVLFDWPEVGHSKGGRATYIVNRLKKGGSFLTFDQEARKCTSTNGATSSRASSSITDSDSEKDQ